MRTGIAVIAFGFVVAQFNVFVARDARAAALGNSEQRHEFAHLFGPPKCYGGLRSLSARSCCPSGPHGWSTILGSHRRRAHATATADLRRMLRRYHAR